MWQKHAPNHNSHDTEHLLNVKHFVSRQKSRGQISSNVLAKARTRKQAFSLSYNSLIDIASKALSRFSTLIYSYLLQTFRAGRSLHGQTSLSPSRSQILHHAKKSQNPLLSSITPGDVVAECAVNTIRLPLRQQPDLQRLLTDNCRKTHSRLKKKTLYAFVKTKNITWHLLLI